MPQRIIQKNNEVRMSHKIKSICLLCSVLCSFLLFWLPALCQNDFSSIEQLLKQNQKGLENNVVAAIWKDGKIVFQKQIEKEQGDFNAKTQTSIQACGNWLTAALVMTFVDQGKLSLDDKISKYIPIFSTYMKGYITIRNCLTNTTGIQVDAGMKKAFEKSKFETLEDQVNAFASKHEIQANPSTEFFYSPIGPNIVGRVLEIVGKKGFDRLMMERITRPLKMRGTTFANDEGGAIDPAMGGKSTVNDYLNFLSMLLNKGMFEGKRVLSEQAIREMEKMQFTAIPVKYIPKPATGWHYGLGEWVQEMDTKGETSVLNSINFAGSFVYIDKCRNYAAVVFTKNILADPPKDFYRKFKDAVDAQMQANCE
jgi:CubicO group peptidase (beta-lactamase class C family)